MLPDLLLPVSLLHDCCPCAGGLSYYGEERELSDDGTDNGLSLEGKHGRGNLDKKKPVKVKGTHRSWAGGRKSTINGPSFCMHVRPMSVKRL